MVKKISKITLFISLPILILLLSFTYCVFDIDYFNMKFIENNTAEVTGIRHEKLIEISEEILKYLKDERTDLIFFEEVNGQVEQVFEEREITHMVDVKHLFTFGFIIRNISFILVVISVIVLYIKDKRGLIKTVALSSILSLIIISLIGLFMFIDFNRVFNIFHEILFANDLWLLNPKTDIMIQMLPLNFFMDLGIKIVKYYVAGLIILLTGSIILIKMNKK